MNAAEVAISKLFVKAYASPHLVYPGRLDRRRHSEVSDARAYDHLLDHRARDYRLHHRRGRNSHVRSADKRFHPAGFILSTLGAILILFVCIKLRIHFPRVG